MPIFWCTAYLLLLVAMGYAVFSAIAPGRRGIVEILGVSATLGAGTIGLLLLWLSMFGFAPDRWVLGILAAATCGGLALLAESGRLMIPSTKFDLRGLMRDPLVLVSAGIIVYLAVIITSRSMFLATIDWDAFSIWQFKAKALAEAPLTSLRPFFSDLSLSYMHHRYPLLVPMMSAGAMAAGGNVDDRLGKVISPLLYLAMGAIIYSGLRQRLRRSPASVLTALFMCLPAMTRFADVGTADLPLACFEGGSILFLIRWLDRQSLGDLAIALLFSAFGVMTKNEGIALAGINGLVAMATVIAGRRRRQYVSVVGLLAMVILLLLPWFLWARDLPRTDEDYGSRLSISTAVRNLPRLPQITEATFGEMGFPTNGSRAVEDAWRHWGGFWYLPPLLALLGFRALSNRSIRWLWVLLILQLASYVFVFLIAPAGWSALLNVTLIRLLLHATPAAALLIGWQRAQIGGGSQEEVLVHP